MSHRCFPSQASVCARLGVPHMRVHKCAYVRACRPSVVGSQCSLARRCRFRCAPRCVSRGISYRANRSGSRRVSVPQTLACLLCVTGVSPCSPMAGCGGVRIRPSFSGKWILGGAPCPGARGVWWPFLSWNVWVDGSLVSCDAGQTQSLRGALSGLWAVTAAAPHPTSD